MPSALILVLWFLFNRPCLPFWLSLNAGHWEFPALTAVIVLSLPSMWLFIFICLGWRQRAILGVWTVIAVLLFLAIPDKRLIPTPAAESSVVGALVKMQSLLQADKINHSRLGFSETLPKLAPSFPIERFYQFEYRPERSPDGTVDRFEIAASLTAGARSCGCIRSFVIGSEGDVHYTSDSRSATARDAVLDIAPEIRRTWATR